MTTTPTPRRFQVSGYEYEIDTEPDGKFVLYEDYATLRAENEKLVQELDLCRGVLCNTRNVAADNAAKRVARIAQLEEALTWYADEKVYLLALGFTDLTYDRGQRARTALGEKREAE